MIIPTAPKDADPFESKGAQQRRQLGPTGKKIQCQWGPQVIPTKIQGLGKIALERAAQFVGEGRALIDHAAAQRAQRGQGPRFGGILSQGPELVAMLGQDGQQNQGVRQVGLSSRKG